jgi:cysteinyl-tRNA synthetase
MPLRLYNSLTKREEEFRPLDPAGKRVTFYSCGPTVYDYAHIGNFRAFLNADLLRRTLELLGYDVRQVMNMTDVGHMTDDDVADGAGEDKMAAAGRRLLEAKKAGKLPAGAEGVDPNNPYAIADYYAGAFIEDAKTLGLKIAFDRERDASLMPRPTEYVRQMVEMIEGLVRRRHAYVARDGVVYFDVQSFPAYGALSGNTLDNLRAGEGGRVSAANQAVKKHPADFMLWKPDPKHIMKWPSPWGEGYPGWHIECSAMARALLGDEIDLHSGGEDNIFPHHECEIAQSCGATGRPSFARYWFHTRFLLVDGEKMSKSKGNFYTLRDLLAKGASPAAVRLAILGTHYRVNSNFTMQVLDDAKRRYDYWKRADQYLGNLASGHEGTSFHGFLRAREEVEAALCDDLNISLAVASIDMACNRFFLHMRETPSASLQKPLVGARKWRDERDTFHTIARILLGDDLFNDRVSEPTVVDPHVELLLAERNAARARKDFAASDRIRDELKAMGIAIKDGPNGTTWERIIQ